MDRVFLYAGQGSQHVGMGLDFYEEFDSYRQFVDGLEESRSLKQLMHQGPLEELSKTENTQACMAVFAAGVTRLLAERGIKPAAACGLSLGEYGALHAAGVFDAEEYVKLVSFRGKAMMEAAKGTSCSMSAILGMDSSKIRQICEAYAEEHDQNVDGNFITVANYNCPGQTVICGDEPAVVVVEAILKGNGAKRCVRLNVSGPFHTRYMAPAGEKLACYFADMEERGVGFGQPQIPVAMNATGELLEMENEPQTPSPIALVPIAQLLVKQVRSSVYLEADLKALLAKGYTDFIEIGPGNALAGFLKKTAREVGVKVNVVSIDTVADFKKVVEQEADL